MLPIQGEVCCGSPASWAVFCILTVSSLALHSIGDLVAEQVSIAGPPVFGVLQYSSLILLLCFPLEPSLSEF